VRQIPDIGFRAARHGNAKPKGSVRAAWRLRVDPLEMTPKDADVTLRVLQLKEDSEFVFLVKKAALDEYIEQTWGWDESFEPITTQIIVESGYDVGWMVVVETDREFQLQEIYR
jgi:hypothetical protein